MVGNRLLTYQRACNAFILGGNILKSAIFMLLALIKVIVYQLIDKVNQSVTSMLLRDVRERLC